MAVVGATSPAGGQHAFNIAGPFPLFRLPISRHPDAIQAHHLEMDADRPLLRAGALLSPPIRTRTAPYGAGQTWLHFAARRL